MSLTCLVILSLAIHKKKKKKKDHAFEVVAPKCWDRLLGQQNLWFLLKDYRKLVSIGWLLFNPLPIICGLLFS